MRIRSPKRLFFATLLLLAWLGFVIEGAQGLLKSSASLTSNSISTGTAELLVSNSQNPSSTIYEATRPGFALEVNPGQTMEKFFLLKNSSQADIPLDVDAMVLLQNNTSSLSEHITLQIVAVDELGQPVGAPISGSLASMANRHSTVFGTIAKGTAQRFKLSATLDPTVEVQGDALTYDLVLTGTQKL